MQVLAAILQVPRDIILRQVALGSATAGNRERAFAWYTRPNRVMPQTTMRGAQLLFKQSCPFAKEAGRNAG